MNAYTYVAQLYAHNSDFFTRETLYSSACPKISGRITVELGSATSCLKIAASLSLVLAARHFIDSATVSSVPVSFERRQSIVLEVKYVHFSFGAKFFYCLKQRMSIFASFPAILLVYFHILELSCIRRHAPPINWQYTKCRAFLALAFVCVWVLACMVNTALY